MSKPDLSGAKSAKSRKSLSKRITAHQIGEQISLLIFFDIVIVVALAAYLTLQLGVTGVLLRAAVLDGAGLHAGDHNMPAMPHAEIRPESEVNLPTMPQDVSPPENSDSLPVMRRGVNPSKNDLSLPSKNELSPTAEKDAYLPSKNEIFPPAEKDAYLPADYGDAEIPGENVDVYVQERRVIPAEPNVLYDEYSLAGYSGEPAGIRLIKTAASVLGLPVGSHIDFAFNKLSNVSILNGWADVRSSFILPLRDDYYLHVEYVHNTLFLSIFRAAAVFLALQILVVVRGAFRIGRHTRRTLRPITELTLAAQSISAAQSAPAFTGGGAGPAGGFSAKATDAAHERQTINEPALKLSGAIDTLNMITEQHLDRRISIDDERVELKGLAQAINSMLDRLDAAYQAQLRFVSDASHELRTPISVIQGYANLLDRWGKNDEKTLQESIDALKNEAESMKQLVEQLLFLARGDNRSIKFLTEDFDVSVLVEEVWRETKMIDGSHDVQVNASPGLIIRGDYQLFKQALRIFTDNSVKYTPAGGRITLSAMRSEARPGYVDIVVRDSGIGIPEEALPHIFDRFFRADESRARRSGGTGLGLSIAKWIIDNHNGVVDVVSRKDAGSKFTISVPESPAESIDDNV